MKAAAMNRGYGLGILFLLLLPVLLFVAYHSFTGPDSTEEKPGKFSSSEALPLATHMKQIVGIEAPVKVYDEAVTYTIENLAAELDIDLENYDLSLEDYQAIVEAAATKFGDCHQYKLYALAPGLYSCYTCVSQPKVILKEGQTFKIGQTCGTEKTRYVSGCRNQVCFTLLSSKAICLKSWSPNTLNSSCSSIAWNGKRSSNRITSRVWK